MNRSKKLGHLEELLDFAPPEDLRKSLMAVLFSSLENQEELPPSFKKNMQDVYALIQFLDKIKAESAWFL